MKSSLQILVTADPEIPVPPRLYGGIERIIDIFIGGLVDRGHQLTLLANRESTPRCELVPFPGASSAGRADTIANMRLVARETRRRHPDVVQSFGRLAYLLPILARTTPKVMSYQRPITRRTVTWASRFSRGSLYFTGVSQNVVAPVEDCGRWRVIYNAVPVDRYHCAPTVAADAPLMFLGRVEWIKGTHLAIDVARRSGRRLVIAGNVPSGPEHQAYFQTHIQPHLASGDVTYVGEIDDRSKNDLLGRAAALLMPILWDEPFGIVMTEAMACGTPVIGLRRGSVPEVVDDGVTGFVCADVHAMVNGVANLARIDRTACRRSVERRFSPTALLDAYENLYSHILRPAGAVGIPRSASV